MFSSLFSRLFAAIMISMLVLVTSYMTYTSLAFSTLTQDTKESLNQLTNKTLEQRLTRQVKDSSNIIDAVYRGLTLNVDIYFDIFTSLIPVDKLVVGQNRIDIAGKSTPVVSLDNQILNGNYELVDAFSNISHAGSVATLFVRDGENFVRVTTSHKKEDGTRAIGTVLDVKNILLIKKYWVAKATRGLQPCSVNNT